METESLKINLLGAGNLAWHLGPALQQAGHTVLQVFSRTEGSARSLAERMGVEWTSDPGRLNPEAGLLLFCIPDRAIREFSCRIELKTGPIMVHTAGSVPMDVFSGIATDYGVLYPLMTFSRDREMDFSRVPVCIEANNPESLAAVERMARGISGRIVRMDSEQRRFLHLAGVIASNFSNHMYHLSRDLMSDRGLDFGLLMPLIMETTSKATEMDPAEAQTGPASRNDTEVVRAHIDLLKGYPELQKIYTFVSESITNHFRS